MKPSRQSRGSYSKLICLNCRARKIRCILPVQDEDLNPSGSPQSPDRACTRCSQLGLQCVIDRTILGRPSSKRKQSEDAAHASRTRSIDTGSPTGRGDEEEQDVDVEGFVMSQVRDEIDGITTSAPQRPRGNIHEIYQALLEPISLMSTLVARDSKFGAACGNISPSSRPVDITRILNDHALRLMEERLYYPYVPSMSTLVKESISRRLDPSSELSHKVLILILCLIAIDARSSKPLPKDLHRQDIQDALSSYGQELLFDPPHNRNCILALELMTEYYPSALVTRQRAVAASIKGHTLIMTMKRIADHLELNESQKKLQSSLSATVRSSEDLLPLIFDTFRWCRILYLAANIGGLITRNQVQLLRLQNQFNEAVVVLDAAVPHIRSCAVTFMYLRLKIAYFEIQAHADIKLHRTDLNFLATIITSYFKLPIEQGPAFAALLNKSGPQAESEVAKTLISNEIVQSSNNISRLGISFAVFSGYLPHTQLEPDISDVIQLSDHIIHNIKLGPDWDSPASQSTDSSDLTLPSFLTRFGPRRPDDMSNALRNFIAACSKLELYGVPWSPPCRPTATGILFECKVLVEENAARMKGWRALCDNVDTQLLLFEDCARLMENFDTQDRTSQSTAVEEGSLYIISAKLMRSLATIIRGWRKRIVEQQRRDIVGQVSSDPLPFANLSASAQLQQQTNQPQKQAAVHNAFPVDDNGQPIASLDDIWANEMNWSEANFDDWAVWPQAQPFDFGDALGQEGGRGQSMASRGFGLG